MSADARQLWTRAEPLHALTYFAPESQQVFEEAYADAPDEAARYRLAQQVKKLTLPDQMGERFQAMVLARGMDMVPLPADMLEADQGDRL